MTKTRPKPPKESKADLMADITVLCRERFLPDSPESALLYVLNYFTALDLEGIRNSMEKER